jgi:hypothetical protein
VLEYLSYDYLGGRNLPEGVREAICIAVAAAFKVEKEARTGDVGIASGICGVEVASGASGIGGAGGDGGVVGIGPTSGASSMWKGSSKSQSSRKRSRHGRSKSPSSRRRKNKSLKLRSWCF